MFEDKDTLINQLDSPLSIAAMALDEVQDRLGGTKIIADVNSPFCHLLEFGSSVSAMVIQAIEEKYPLLYAKRAQSMDDLFMHMSDYDYLRLYATPSSTTIRMAFPKKYLTENALSYNSNYKQVTIPKDTVFYIGKYPFGMYYPVNILINNYTNTFTAVYDTTTTNSLFTLTTNVVEKYDWTYQGLEYVLVDIPIYQFAKSTVDEAVDSSLGFVKQYTFNNEFYAVKLFNYKDGVYTEMSQTLNKIVYDSEVPTALVQVMQDEHKIRITVPQIYFDNGTMGSKISLEFYTTLGPLDIDTTNISGSSIRANFGLNSRETTEYSSILKNLPFDTIMSLNNNKITGGSSAVTLETLRKRVVYDNLIQSVPITESDIEVYLEDEGFYVEKHKDNVTDRIYYAYRTLTDTEGGIIPTVTLQMRMVEDYLDTDTYTGFIQQSDNSVTVLPTTLYRYRESPNDVVPLTIDELGILNNMDKSTLAETLNENQYLRSPFHIRYDLSDDYPEAISYNLMTPSIDTIVFEAENYNVTAKMMTYTATISHIDDGIGGYDVYLSVSKSDDLADIAEDDILVYVFTKTTEGYTIGTTASYVEDNDSRSIYMFHIDTNYHIDENEALGITNFQNTNYNLSEHSVSLTANYYLVYLVRKTALENMTYEIASTSVSSGVPDDYLSEYVALSRQYITITLGHSLADVIKNTLEISTTGRSYEVWAYDVPALYETDQYARDTNGNLLFSIDDEGHVSLTLEHAAGEQMVDERGDLVWEHRAGDVRYSANGEPIEAAPATKIWYTEMMFIDAKVYASERTAEMDFKDELPETLETYFDTVRTVQDQLLERTMLYFKPVRTTGTATFNMGDGVTSTQNIEMSFAIQCYVKSYVKQDTSVQETIIDAICSAIEENIQTKYINMLDIFHSVQEQLTDYIEYFTLLGINDDITNQTFVIIDEDAQPSLKRRLVLTDDNILSLEKAIDIEFIALENNTDEMASYEVE